MTAEKKRFVSTINFDLLLRHNCFFFIPLFHSGWTSNIILCDILQSNRDEVQKFWIGSDDAFGWKHYFNFVGVLELNPEVKTIEERTRNAIKGVYFCDITRSGQEMFMISETQTFDVIIASLVFDVVANSEALFEKSLKNVQDFLAQNGLLIIQGTYKIR